MTTKVIGAGPKPVTAHSITPREDDKAQGSQDTGSKTSRKRSKKDVEAATPEQQAETRLGLAVRGY